MKIKDVTIPNTKIGRVDIIVDQSGSMAHQTLDTIGSINSYITGLKFAPAKMLVSLYTFDSDRGLRRLLRNVDANEAPTITTAEYQPAGGTPLYEAVMAVIAESNDPHVVVIITDGADTSGQSSLGVSSLIGVRQQQGWEFLFLGAGLDRWNATNISSTLGIHANRTMNYDRNQQGRAMNLAAGATAAYASSGFTASNSFDLSEDQQDLTKDKPKGGVMQNGGVVGQKVDLVDPADGTTLIIREVSEGEIKKQTVKP